MTAAGAGVAAATPATAPPSVPKAASATPASVGRDLRSYVGLGTWVDAYDYSSEFQANGAPPPVVPAAVDDMARQGVKTLYLQASKDDVRSPGDLVDPEIAGEFLTRAHAHGMRVVAWYLPKFGDVDSDLRHLLAMRSFAASGQRYDGTAVDIEWRNDVPEPAIRNQRLVALSQRLRAAAAPGEVLGAIVMPPVVTDVINPSFWPGFPWKTLGSLYDVWMPMAYWTSRTEASGYRDAFRYTEQNIVLLRRNLGNPTAAIHPIGGIGDRSTDADDVGFVMAAKTQHALGASIYDFRTTAPAHWAILRGAPAPG